MDTNYKDYGIDLKDADYMLSLVGRYYILIIKGGFDFDSITSELNNIPREVQEYLGITIWEGFYGSVALTEDLIIMGNEEDIRACLEVIKEESSSVLENKEVMGFIDRLTDAPQLQCSIFEEGDSPQDDILGMGSSFDMIRKETARIVRAYLFINEDSAQSAFEELEEGIKSGEVQEGVTIKQLDCDGRFLVVKSEEQNWLY